MISATLSSKFQLAIPKAVREELALEAGQKFAVITKGASFLSFLCVRLKICVVHSKASTRKIIGIEATDSNGGVGRYLWLDRMVD